jgi:hypothetical protein
MAGTLIMRESIFWSDKSPFIECSRRIEASVRERGKD